MTRQHAPSLVDVHSHYFGTDLHDAQLPLDPRWPRLVTDSAERGRIMLDDQVFREVHSSLWDVHRRVCELDESGVALQVISPVPVMMASWASRGAALEYAAATNDSLAKAVAASGGRLEALGAVPLPHVDDAVEELARAVATLGLRGVQIGTQIAGLDLDDPALLPFFEAAEALDAAVFVHPTDGGGGVVRRQGRTIDFGLGMTTDTAIAATALVMGGVLERFPRLRVGMAHGCGTFAWAYPRLRLGASIFDAADASKLDSVVRRLWVDSLVFDPEHLTLLVHRFGADRLMFGTDHPFIPGQLTGAEAFLSKARSREASANGLAFLGLTSRSGS